MIRDPAALLTALGVLGGLVATVLIAATAMRDVSSPASAVWQRRYDQMQAILYDGGAFACSPEVQFNVHEAALYFPTTFEDGSPNPDWRLEEDAVRQAWRDWCGPSIGLPTSWDRGERR